MKRRIMLGGTYALLAGVTALAAFMWLREAAREREARSTFCRRQLLAIDTAISHGKHLQAWMEFHFLDQATLELCLDDELPVDESEASACWIRRGADDCYLNIANELRARYQGRYQWPSHR